MVKLDVNTFHVVAIVTIFNFIENFSHAHAFPTNVKSETSLSFGETSPKEMVAENRKFLNIYERTKRQLNIIQSKIADIVHPKPIVDTLREEDKYGNTVEHKFGKSIVKVVENVSNVINSVFAFPIDTVKKASRTATEALNNLGGKLVGLQK